MTTISNLYQQLKEGEVTRENFMRRVRNEYSHIVSPTNSFDDTIRILKNKGVLTEAHQLSTEQIIDRLNPYAVKKGIEVEIAKCKGEIDLQKIKERVAKNLSKNQKYYEADQYANAKIVDKHDSKQEMRPVKKELVDKDNAMRKPKGYSPDKANTKASKKENRKGKPKGVKLMKENDGGQMPQQMDYTGQDITVSVDPNTKKPLGEPKPGKVVRQHGNILYVDFGDGQETPITISVVDNAEQEPQLSKSELDKAWSDWDKTGQGRISAMEEKEEMGPGKIKEIVGKLKEYLSKKKSLKRGIKEEEDTGVVRISKNDPKKAEKIKKVKARGGTYEIYDPNSQ